MWRQHQSVVSPRFQKASKDNLKGTVTAKGTFRSAMMDGKWKDRKGRVERMVQVRDMVKLQGARWARLKVALIRWNACPLAQIPSCGARRKRPKLMSLGRTICLSGLLLRDKTLLFASLPIHCPRLWKKWQRMKRRGQGFSDVSYCTPLWWDAWHLADGTYEKLSAILANYKGEIGHRKSPLQILLIINIPYNISV